MIDSFSGEYDFLSNFYEAPICYDGISYPTNEHAFQAAKTLDFVKRLEISDLRTPGQAKKQGRLVSLRSNWEYIKIHIMKEICWIKFLSHTDLRIKLLKTANDYLIEGNTWGDKFWGVCDREGENHLGLILMELRNKLTTISN